LNTRELFLTFFYTGKSPIASGTVGSLAAIPPALLILEFFSQSTLFLASLLIFAIGIRQTDAYEKEKGVHDASEIVIDEVAGMWLAMSLCTIGFWQVVALFFLFRLFDIWKPSVIGKIDRDVNGGLGVMGDDMVAGVAAGLSCAALFEAIKYF